MVRCRFANVQLEGAVGSAALAAALGVIRKLPHGRLQNCEGSPVSLHIFDRFDPPSILRMPQILLSCLLLRCPAIRHCGKHLLEVIQATLRWTAMARRPHMQIASLSGLITFPESRCAQRT